MFRLCLLIVLVLAVLQPAFAADCPDAVSAKSGFILERQGTKAEIRPASDHFVHVVNVYPSGKRQDVIYFRGLFPVSRFDNTTRTMNFPLSDLRTIFPLTVKARRAITYAPAQPGKVGASVSLEMTVTGQERVRLGTCSYEVLVIRNRLMNAEGRVISEDTDLYSTELGFLLGKRYDENGGRHTTTLYESIKPIGTAPR